MSDNPYLSSFEDDDEILNPKNVSYNNKHTYDGTPCMECNGTIHQVNIDDDLPPEVQETIDSLMDSVPESERNSRMIVTTTESPAAQILKEIQEFFTNLEYNLPVGAIIRACVESLDKLNGGLTTTLIAMYHAEQQIIVYQDQVNILAGLETQIHKFMENSDSSALQTLLDVVKDLALNLAAKLNDELIPAYLAACDGAERNPRQDLLAGNLQTNPNDLLYQLMFHFVSSSLSREYTIKENNNNNQTTTTQEEGTLYVNTDPS